MNNHSRHEGLLRRFSGRKGISKNTNLPLPPVCPDVSEWMLAHGGARPLPLYEKLDVVRQPPNTIEPEIHSEFQSRLSGTLRGKYLVELRGARIRGENGLVVLADGSYAVESIYNHRLLEQDPEYTNPATSPIVKKVGCYFSLLCIWSKHGNYYHWIHDALLRLYRVTELLPADVRYIVPNELKPFQIETLGILGIKPEQLEYHEPKQVWEVELLYFCPPTSNSGSSRSEAVEWLRNSFWHGCSVVQTQPYRYLYLSRRQWRDRHTVNEDQIERLLFSYGFESISPESLSVAEQVQLFSQAKTVVSSHGSQFTNILFSPPNLTVIDIIEPSMFSWGYVFWTLSDAMKHVYWYFVGESVPHTSGRNDTLIPMDKLQKTLDRALR